MSFGRSPSRDLVIRVSIVQLDTPYLEMIFNINGARIAFRLREPHAIVFAEFHACQGKNGA